MTKGVSFSLCPNREKSGEYVVSRQEGNRVVVVDCETIAVVAARFFQLFPCTQGYEEDSVSKNNEAGKLNAPRNSGEIMADWNLQVLIPRCYTRVALKMARGRNIRAW